MAFRLFPGLIALAIVLGIIVLAIGPVELFQGISNFYGELEKNIELILQPSGNH